MERNSETHHRSNRHRERLTRPVRREEKPRMTKEQYEQEREAFYEQFDQLEDKREQYPYKVYPPMDRLFSDFWRVTQQAAIDSSDKEGTKLEYIAFLLEYGMYEKQTWGELGDQAKSIMERILRLDDQVPLAHYRLAHIYAKKNQQPSRRKGSSHYSANVCYHAIEALRKSKEDIGYKGFQLDEAQHYRIRELLLQTIGHTNEVYQLGLNDVELDRQSDVRPETFLIKVSQRGSEGISQEEYDEIIDDEIQLIYNRCEFPHTISYGGQVCDLTPQQSKILHSLSRGAKYELDDIYQNGF